MMYFRIVLLSLFFHLAFLWVLSGLPAPKREKRAEVEVTYAPSKKPQEKPKKQLVRETHQPKEANPATEAPRFQSEHTKSVKEETKAAHIDMTQNRGGGGGQNQATAAKPDRPTPKEPGEGKPLPPQLMPSQGSPGRPLNLPGVSTVGEILPDNIKVGQWTALNTERYLFYTFFARVEERVRYRWVTNLRAAAESIDPRTLSRQDWTTEVEVVLNKDGYFESAQVRQACGLPSFDFAATKAFQSGAPFLNPPKELVKADGKIRLRYVITVMMTPPARM